MADDFRIFERHRRGCVSLGQRGTVDVPSGLEREFRKEADFLARESFCGRKSNLHSERAASQGYGWGVIACKSGFSKNDGGRRDPMLVVGHEILADHDPIRSDQILDGMRNAVRAQAGSNVGVQDAESADDSAIRIGQQRNSNPVLLRKTLESLLGIIAHCGDAETFPFDQRT